MRIETTILVEPQPKGRPRTAVKGGRVFVYTPKRTVHAESQIRDRIMEFKQYFEKGTPIRLVAIFYRQRPKSLSKRVRLPIAKPDWDQYGKLLCDALEKFLYHTDSQITDARVVKRFGIPPRIELILEEDNEKSAED